ncbi:MAG: helix-turn-helix transcriptional regulator [Acidobacteria bacterium]|nr:helix-turn-helix transcriptional regulator [Acidobacteriota bacterium]
MPRGRKTRGKAGYMISAVAEMYQIHPQTLRLYEREGLLIPSRSNGNTRLYGPEDLEQLEMILKLTRDLGVNISGVAIILNMRKQMEEMQKEMRAFVEFVQGEVLHHPQEDQSKFRTALVRIPPPVLIRTKKNEPR